ncbi:MAG: hypothetical protein KatS3mg131_0459 [Candidatus Tectimicrobiota bacterium]|nr:MAG: hypothetical protein KatS3mg131_0459 [Candidatus Tectomicrobia bacterium]
MRGLYGGLLLWYTVAAVPGASIAQAVWLEDLTTRAVAFRFHEAAVREVVDRLAQLTGWAFFYDPASVQGNVTIATPEKIPLLQALRLLHGIMAARGAMLFVLPPDSPQPVPLSQLLASVSTPPASRPAVVLRNTNARGPQSRPYACTPVLYPVPLWVSVPWPPAGSPR